MHGSRALRRLGNKTHFADRLQSIVITMRLAETLGDSSSCRWQIFALSDSMWPMGAWSIFGAAVRAADRQQQKQAERRSQFEPVRSLKTN